MSVVLIGDLSDGAAGQCPTCWSLVSERPNFQDNEKVIRSEMHVPDTLETAEFVRRGQVAASPSCSPAR